MAALPRAAARPGEPARGRPAGAHVRPRLPAPEAAADGGRPCVSCCATATSGCSSPARRCRCSATWRCCSCSPCGPRTSPAPTASPARSSPPLVVPSLLAPLAGVVIDRFRRRTVMIVTDLATAAVVLLLLLVDGREDLWLLYVVAFLYGASLVAFSSARSALLPAMVDEELLGQANGSLGTGREALRLVAPLAGAALYAGFGGPAVAILDAATFLVSAAALLALRVDEPAPEPHERQLHRRGGGRRPSPARRPGAAHHRRRDRDLHAGARHQRVGLLRDRRRRSGPAGGVRRRPERRAGRRRDPGRRRHHRDHPADRRAAPDGVGLRRHSRSASP